METTIKLKWILIEEFGTLYFLILFIYFSKEKRNTVIVSQ